MQSAIVGKLECHKKVTLHSAASVLPEAGWAAAILELGQVEPAAASSQKASLSPACCLRAIVTLQTSELLL